MAMTNQDLPDPPGGSSAAPAPSESADDGPAMFRPDRAVLLLRERADRRWVEIADRVLSQALAATRRSFPVRAQAPDGPVHVSEQVLVAYLRAAIDGSVAGAAVAAIVVDVDDAAAYRGVTIELVAQFGVELLPLADGVRDIAAATLAPLLGPVTPVVTVSAMHVHVGDVTASDPHREG